METKNIKDYLTEKGIGFTEANGELVTDCMFCRKKKHLYFSKQTGQYDCKVCEAQGNIFTLAKHLGDDIEDITIENYSKIESKKEDQNNKKP